MEGDKRRKREVINKLLSQDVPLDILLISGSCCRSGAWQAAEQNN
jgi:predicted glycosyltransferase